MGVTSITTSNEARKTVWHEELFRDIIMQGFFGPKLGANYVDSLVKGYEYESSPNDVLYVVEDLNGLPAKDKAGKGDKVEFTLLARLSAKDYPGVTTGQTLEGKEVPLTNYNFYLELARYRNAFSAGTPIDWHRAAFPVPKASRDSAFNWASEKIDILCFDALDVTTYSEVFYKTSNTGPTVACEAAATAKAALTAADSKLTPQFIDFVATNLKTGGARERWPVRPVKIDGKNYFIWLIHPDAMFDFSNDSTMQQAHREALERGKTNPLFSGSTLVWKNNIIFEHELCSTGTTAGAGSDVAWATCYILGAQSLCWAWGQRPKMVEYTRDAGEELYHSINMTAKVGKPYFNSITYGSALAYVSRTNTAV
jgi:N4-gp56 family major capsid protein